jgi:hypothetical protein
MMMILIMIITYFLLSFAHFPQTEMSCKRKRKTQEFRYRDTTNVEPEMYDYTSYEGVLISP